MVCALAAVLFTMTPPGLDFGVPGGFCFGRLNGSTYECMRRIRGDALRQVSTDVNLRQGSTDVNLFAYLLYNFTTTQVSQSVTTFASMSGLVGYHYFGGKCPGSNTRNSFAVHLSRVKDYNASKTGNIYIYTIVLGI